MDPCRRAVNHVGFGKRIICGAALEDNGDIWPDAVGRNSCTARSHFSSLSKVGVDPKMEAARLNGLSCGNTAEERELLGNHGHGWFCVRSMDKRAAPLAAQ